jgi:hypothetical protein
VFFWPAKKALAEQHGNTIDCAVLFGHTIPGISQLASKK